jgi:uncharacterized membrane protein YfcA
LKFLKQMTAPINPLLWKPEHQLALALAAALGSLIGLWLGTWRVDQHAIRTAWEFGRCAGYYFQDHCSHFHPTYWLALLLWMIAGAAVGAAIVYIQRLLRH